MNEDIINIFTAYVEPLIKEINYPEFLKEWRLNIDAAQYEINIYANLYKPSEKNKCNRIDSDDYWPTSIKETIQWFLFLAIIEHTKNIMETNNGLISLLLKVSAMFELRLNYKEVKLKVIYISCINCKRETVLFLKINI